MTDYEYFDIQFRALTKADLDELRKHRNQFKTWKNLTESWPINDIMQEKWFEKLAMDKNNLYLIAETINNACQTQAIGLARIKEIDWINSYASVGCDVFENYRGKGYGKKIMNGVVSYCFDYLNLHRLWLLVLETNKAGIAIYKQAGFKKEGVQRKAIFKHGRYWDYIMMGIVRGNRQ